MACELIESPPGKVSGRPWCAVRALCPILSSTATIWAIPSKKSTRDFRPFDVLVTGDQTLSYEQNLIGRKLAVVALSSVEWRIISNYLPRIVAAIDKALPGSFQRVDCGMFTRKKPLY